MKQIECVVRPEKLGAVEQALRNARIGGMTIRTRGSGASPVSSFVGRCSGVSRQTSSNNETGRVPDARRHGDGVCGLKAGGGAPAWS